jgi:hypothetical protein
MKRIFFLIGLFILILGNSGQGGEVKDPVILNIVDGLKRNTVMSNGFGAHQRVVTTRLTDEGTPRRIEEKYLKTIWIVDKPKNILVRVSCKDFEGPIQNSQECVEFTRATMSSSSKPDRIEAEVRKVRWTEMYRNYDFQMLPPEGSYKVLSFRPKKDGISPSSRIEKLLCQMAGKVWVDQDYNIVKAEAKLISPVSFGLGVAAKVNEIGIQYRQQTYRNVQLPSYLGLEFKAKIALFHTEHQRIEVYWSDPYRRSDGVFAQVGTPAQVQTPGITEVSDKR